MKKRSLSRVLISVFAAAVIGAGSLVAASPALADEPGMIQPVGGMVTALNSGYCGGGAHGKNGGFDIGNGRNLGATVVAAHSGRVTVPAYDVDLGRYVIVTHPSGWSTLYAHLDQVFAGNGEIAQGSAIGTVGLTGRTSGAHLHFVIRQPGGRTDFGSQYGYACGQTVGAGNAIPWTFAGMQGTPAPTPPAPPAPTSYKDYSGDGIADLIARDASGVLWNYAGNGNDGFTAPSRVGAGWGGMKNISAGGDYNGDGRNDLWATSSDGTLYRYDGNGSGGFTGTPVGHGWGAMRVLVAGFDYTGDSKPDLLAVRNDGTLWLYAGNGSGRLSAGQQVGAGWSSTRSIVGGDFNGDGKADLLATATDGRLRLYPGLGNGTFGSSVERGSGWGDTALVTGGGDYNGDGLPDILGMTSSGRLLLYPNIGDSQFAAPTQIGQGWSTFTAFS